LTEEVASSTDSTAERPVCPCCGEPDIVQTQYGKSAWFILAKPTARCLLCSTRFEVGRSVFNQIRRPAVGDPVERWEDLKEQVSHTPMSGVQIIVTLVAMVCGVAIAWMLHPWIREWGIYVVLPPAAWAGWWVGRWLRPGPRPARPGRCEQCGYYLKGLAESRCPECGLAIASPPRE
jgi:hypothetical protein